MRTFAENDGRIEGGEFRRMFGGDKNVSAEMRADGIELKEADGEIFLLRGPQKLKPEYVSAYLKNDVPILWKEKTRTTNDDARALAADGSPDLVVCIAEEQSAGKGRLGRQWSSGCGSSVEMSILMRADVPAQKGAGLGLAVSLGVSRAIEDVSGLETKVKWPNDVMANGRKLCGILTEGVIENAELTWIVMGIGVNVNQHSFPDGIRDRATSVAIEIGKESDRVRLAAALIERVPAYVRRFFERGPEGIKDEYEQKSTVLHKVVNVTTAQGIVTGTCVGFGALGELLVSVNHETQIFTANDVSVREAADV